MAGTFADLMTSLMRAARPDGRLARYLLIADLTDLWRWSLANPERVVRKTDGEAEQFPLGSASPQRDC